MIDDTSLEPLLNARFAPIAGYQISDQESGATSYWGYTDKRGAWYIMKGVTAAAVINYTYAKGDSGYDANWTGRGALTYRRFYEVF